MRKALQRAAQALMAAGALGLVRPAVAQTSLPAAKPPSGTLVHTSAQSVTHDAAAASQGKLEEMQVELALLANPTTFAYPLGAKYTGANLELHGIVPSKFIKEQALETARKHCGVPVVDRLQVSDARMLRPAAGSTDELQQGAAALLGKTFEAVADLEIKVADQGYITLKGSCESHEQKLEISKKLRGLNGCCAVDNRLTVKPVFRDGRLVTLVTADGSFAVLENNGYGTRTNAPTHTGHNEAENAWVEAPKGRGVGVSGVTPSVAQTNATSSPSVSPFANVPAYAKAPVIASDPVKAPAPVEPLPPSAPVKPASPPSGVRPAAHDAHPVQIAYATTGFVLFDGESLPEPPLPLAKDKAMVLKQKVAAVCGARAKNVFVEAKPDGVLHVHVQSAAVSENEALTTQIYGLPEMASPNVMLHIELGQ